MSTHEVMKNSNPFPHNEFNEREFPAKEAASMSTSPNCAFAGLVNLEELLERIDHDQELLKEIFGLFRREIPGLLAELRAAIEANTAKRVLSAAHALKGMLANLAVEKGSATAARIEELARAGEVNGFAAELAELEAEMAVLVASVDLYLAGSER